MLEALIITLGLLSAFTPCSWNLNLLLRAYTLKKGIHTFFAFAFLRVLLFNSIALAIYFAQVKLPYLFAILGLIMLSLITLFGPYAVRRWGSPPVDFSPQFFLRNRKLPAGIGLGLSLPYCVLPIVGSLVVSSFALSIPFEIFNLFVWSSLIPTTALVFLKESLLQRLLSVVKVSHVIASMLILGLSVPVSGETNLILFVSSLTSGEIPFYFLVLVSFILGVLTSLGPSTLPFLPAVFGLLVADKKGKGVILGVIEFLLAFLTTHSLAGFLVSLGLVNLRDIFKAEVFSLIVGILLALFGLSLVGVVPLSLSFLSLWRGGVPKGGRFMIGIFYTLSVCPSCTPLLLGAVFLSTLSGDPFKASFLMGVYAIGRFIPVVIAGFMAKEVVTQGSTYSPLARKFAGFLLIGVSLILLKNSLEVIL